MITLSNFINELLAREYFDNSVQAWLIALAIALGINLIAGLLRYALVGRLSRFAEHSRSGFDDALIEAVRSTHQFLVFFVALYVGSRYLELPERANTILKAAATMAVFMQVGLWGAAGLRMWMTRSRKRALESNVSAATSLAAIGFIAQVVLWAIIVLLALDNLGVDVTALVAGLGIGGVAVALAVQNILGDLFASLSIVIDKPFVIGDFVVVDQYMGTVEYVGLKTTRIRSLDGEQIIFSNSDLLKARVRNYKRMFERRVVFAFSVVHHTPAEKLERIPQTVRDIVEAQSKVRFERSHFARIGAGSFDFETVYWVMDPDFNLYMDIQQAINLSLIRALSDAGLALARPTQVLEVSEALQQSASRFAQEFASDGARPSGNGPAPS